MRKLAATLAALVLVTGSAAIVFWMQLRPERARGVELAARVAALEAAAPSVAIGTSSAAATGAAVAGATDVAVSATPATAGPQSDAMGSAMSAMAAEMVRTQYPDLAAELGLGKEEAERFLALLVRQETEVGTESMALFSGGDSASERQELQARMIDKELARRDEQAAMLGSRFARWEEYQSVASARQEIELLRMSLAATPNPLSDVQARTLEVAFAAEQTRYRDDERSWLASDAARRSPNMMREQMHREVDNRKRHLEIARPHLSKAQLDVYSKQIDTQVSMVSAMVGAMGDGETR